MRRFGSLALIAMAACGRVNFDGASSDGGAGGDDGGGGDGGPACRPMIVQGTCFDPGPTSLSLGDVTVGHMIAVEIEFDDTNATISSVTDSLGNQYTPLSAVPIRSSIQTAQMWVAKVTNGGEATITPTLSAVVGGLSMHAQEYADVDVVAMPPFGGFSNIGMSAEGLVSASVDHTLVVAHGVSTGLTNGPTGWNVRDGCNGNLVADLIADAGQVDVAFPLDQNVAWIVELVSFPPLCD